MKTELRLFVVFASFAASQSLAAREPTVASAETFIDSWAASYLNNDATATLDFYLLDESSRIIVSAGVMFQGEQAIEKFYAESYRDVEFTASKAKAVKTQLLDDMAIITFEHRYEFTVRADKSRFKGHIRTSSILRRADGEWKIVHEHSSPIAGIERIESIQTRRGRPRQ